MPRLLCLLFLGISSYFFYNSALQIEEDDLQPVPWKIPLPEYTKEVSSPICLSFLHSLLTPFPVLLIDKNVLKALQIDSCERLIALRIKVAVDNINQADADDSRFEFLMLTNDTDTDYLRFATEPIRIVPKNFTTYSIGSVQIPKNIPRFLEFWKRSILVNCLNLFVPREHVKGHQFNHGKEAAGVLAEFRDLMIQFDMFPFLNGGTLLGWYRECGFIPHTGDMDLAVFSEDFRPHLVHFFHSRHSSFRLLRKMGKLNDSFELTVHSKMSNKVSIDLFLMYRKVRDDGTSFRWVGGASGNGDKYQYTYPEYDPWCSSDLHGHLFWVTCSPHLMIPFEYGKLWYKDRPSSDYQWNESSENVKPNGRWSREEMKQVYMVY